MRYLFLLFLIAMAGHINAQTKPIAYKSHSGDMDFFHPDAQPEDDFGEIVDFNFIHKVIKLNDSTIVEVHQSYPEGEIIADTILHHPIFKDTAQYWSSILTDYYGNNTKFEGFEEIKLPEETKKTTESVLPAEQTPKGKKGKHPGKKTKKKNLDEEIPRARATVLPVTPIDPPNNGGGFSWFYFSIGVYVTMLLMLLLLFRRPVSASSSPVRS